MSIESVEKHLIEAIQERLKEVSEEELQSAHDRIRQRMAEYVSGTVIKLMQYVRVENMGQEIRLRIEMPEVKK